MLGSLLLQVAESRGADGVGAGGHAILVILKAKLARVFTNDNDIFPAETLEALAGNFTQRGGEINEVDTGEVGGDINMAGHGLDVVSGATTDLKKGRKETWLAGN